MKFSGVSKKYPLAISCLIQDKSLLLQALNYTTGFPGSSASRWHAMGLLSLYNCLNQYLRTNCNSVLFLKRILANIAVRVHALFSFHQIFIPSFTCVCVGILPYNFNTIHKFM